MSKRLQNETVLALSQLMPLCTERNPYSVKLGMLVPFLALKAGNYSLAQSNFAQANRLHEMVWGDSRPLIFSSDLGVSKNSAQSDDNAINQRGNATGENWSIAQHDLHSMTKNQSEFAINYQRKDTNLNSELVVNDRKIGGKKANLNSQQQTDAVLDDNSESNCRSIINRTLSFRPVLLEGTQKGKVSSLKQSSLRATQIAGMQLMGLLSGNKFSRKTPKVTSAGDKNKQDYLSGSEFSEVKPNASWSMPLAASQSDDGVSVSATLAQVNYSLNDSALVDSVLAGKRIQSNINRQRNSIDAVAYPGHNQMMGSFNAGSYYGENLEHSVEQPLPNLNQQLPKNIVYKKQPQSDFSSLFGDSSANLNQLTRQIDKVVNRKIQDIKASDKRLNSDLKLIKRDIKKELVPEKLISDEMIRVLLKKLQKQALEKRFRLGLLN